MAQSYGLTEENKGKVDSALDFPRLKLEKKGEKARLAIFGITTADDGKRGLAVPQPEGGYYFDLRIPGADREYVGSFECLADEAMKAEGGFDPDVCPHCAAVLSGKISEDVMRERKRKFVLPVIRYKTKANSSELITPYSVEAIAWRFTDRYFNVLIDEHNKWSDSGGLLGHDVTLTLEVKQYQTFTISMEPNAAYKEDPELGKLVLETFISQTSALSNGLGRVLGNRLNAVDLEKKIADTVESAAQLGTGVAPTAIVPTIDQGTIENIAADLLGGVSEVPAAVVSEPVSEGVQEVSATPAVAAVEVVAAAPAASTEVDFDEFFSK